jgi:hypothetical protein
MVFGLMMAHSASVHTRRMCQYCVFVLGLMMVFGLTMVFGLMMAHSASVHTRRMYQYCVFVFGLMMILMN